MATKQTLTPEDWIKAAFKLLTSAGPKAIRVDYLCKELGVTKGSFYWHFEDLAALRAAMVEHWRRIATSDVIASMVSPELSPRDLFIRFIEDILQVPTREYGGPMTEVAIRHWAAGDEAVQTVVRDADTERLAFLTLQMRGAGLTGPEARSRATLIYATLVGLKQLTGEPALPRMDIPGFVDAMLRPSPASAAAIQAALVTTAATARAPEPEPEPELEVQ
ncbi:TetR family transcriptional regulator [Hoeflea halophila]|uniref:TetR family transcriptional regulator n=1 Tax=Hoeflea halophila TaxID=714899 RepID=A0A286I9U6_9HYPH|nr:TetR/AcrR family transcriptional regulator [Hoeflea halophila]SOE16870.1 TetR family transcriptional regulator [Hoeflea halophila]